MENTSGTKPSSLGQSRGFLHPRLRTVIGIVAVASLIPYAVMKVMWLLGSRIGMVEGAGEDHMHDTRTELGNLITVGLVVVAAVVVLVLTSPWGLRLPWWTIVIPAAGATGALAPIALGLPVGVVIQAAVLGNVRSGGEGNLSGSVFALVYGGFGLFGIALATLLVDYMQRRWAGALASGPLPPSGAGFGCLR